MISVLIGKPAPLMRWSTLVGHPPPERPGAWEPGFCARRMTMGPDHCAVEHLELVMHDPGVVQRIRDTGTFLTCTCAGSSAIPVFPFIADNSPAPIRPSGHLSMVRVIVLFWICALLFALVALGLSPLIGWVAGQVDGQAVLDFVAPTAAQARDGGWVALSEGL